MKRHFLVIVAALVGLVLSLLVRFVLEEKHKRPAPRSSSIPSQRVVSAARDTPATIRPSRPVESGRPLEGSATIHLLDAATGADVEGAKLTIVNGPDRREVQRQGAIFTLGPLPLDGATLEVDAPKHFRLSFSTSDLLPGDCSLFLVQEEPLMVRCIAEDGRVPIPGAVIRLANSEEEGITSQTGDDGWAGLKNGISLQTPSTPCNLIPDYSVSLEVEARGFLAKTVRVPVKPGTDWSRIQIPLEPSRVFVVRVVDRATKAGVPHAAVVHQWNYLNHGRLNTSPTVVSADHEGRLELEVRDGATGIEMVVAAESYATQGVVLGDVEGVSGTEPTPKELVVELEPGYDVEGFVINEQGGAVENVMVDLDPVGRPDFTDWMRAASYWHLKHLPDMAPTDSEGSFHLKRIPQGTYKVALIHTNFHADPDNPLLSVGAAPASWLGVVRRGLTLDGMIVNGIDEPLPGVRVALRRVDESGKVINGFSKLVTTGDDGAFHIPGVSPGSFQATILGGLRYGTHIENINSMAPPVPWRIVLGERGLATGEADGTVWLRFSEGKLFVPDFLVHVALYSGGDLSLVESFSQKLEGGELHRTGVPPGPYRVVVRPEGYAPSVLDSVVIVPVPEAPVEVQLSPGLAAAFEVNGPCEAGVVKVREARTGTLVSEVYSPPVEDGSSGNVVARLLPGSYVARLSTNSGASEDAAFAVGAFLSEAAPCARLALRK
jgi:hypothetical protein